MEKLADKQVELQEKAMFLQRVYCPYLQSVIDHIKVRMESSDLISSMSLFDPHHLPDIEEQLSDYDMEKMRTLINFYSVA